MHACLTKEKGDIQKSEELFWDFFKLYHNYCLSQVGSRDAQSSQQVQDELTDLRKAAGAVFKLEHILGQLKSIKDIKNEEQNVTAKKKWLQTFQAELNNPDMQAGINIMRKTMPASVEESELYTLIANKIPPSVRKLKDYPILNGELPLYTLGKKERKELYWHRKSGVARIIDWLCRGAQSKPVRKVMPFYLLDLFANDSKPLRPFKRNPYYFRPDKLKFQGNISFCKHPTSIRKQESHYNLYQALIAWCDRYFKGEYDRSLCNALYPFYRRQLVTQFPSEENNFVSNDLVVLKEAIRKVLNMPFSMFRHRTEMEISVNEFYDFFYYDTTREVLAVRKALKTLITEEDAAKFEKVAFLDPQGFGYSFHPDSWYQSIETWIDGIISKDKVILEYIDSSNVNSTLHQAQIDLAIQFICCEKIRESMTQEVLQFCKHAFSPSCQ